MNLISFVNDSKNMCVIFSKDACPHCHMAIKDLKKIKADYSTYDCTNIEKDMMDTLFSFTNCKTFPQIFVKKQYIGGYRELAILLMTNRIYSMLDLDPDF